MSEQSLDVLLVNGERLRIDWTYPLEALFMDTKKPTSARKHWKIVSLATSENRGYYGTWELKNNELFLVDIETNFIRYKGFLFWKKRYLVAANVSDLFPEAINNQVKATWFSGRLTAYTKFWKNPVDDVLKLHFDSGNMISYQWCHIEMKDGKMVKVPYDRPL